MTVPGPTSGMDPMPARRPRPTGPGAPIDPGAPLPDAVPDPDRPGRAPGTTGPHGPDGPSGPRGDGLVLLAAGREDRWRHVVDVEVGVLGDPEALRARCGAAVGGVVPGLGAASADCPRCVGAAGAG